MKTVGNLLVVIALTILPLYGQSSVKRHPGEHLHYNVALADGDIGKITGVNVHLRTNATPPPNQPGAARQFGGNCQKSVDPKIWTCDVLIPLQAVSGDYQLFNIGVGTPDFGKSYEEDFHVPLVPIENPNTFTPPSKVTVTEQP